MREPALPVKVAPADIHARVRAVLQVHLHLPDEELLEVLSVWAMGTHCFREFASYPQLAFLGGKGSGKSQALGLLARFSNRPRHLVSPSTASLFHLIDAGAPTLFIDEASILFAGRSEASAIFKAGYKRGATVSRYDVATRSVVEYDTYCPKAIAYTGDLDHVIADRCIAVPMRPTRRAIPLIDDSEERRIEVVRDFVVDWALTAHEARCEALETERTRCPVSGRERELWLPLLALASALGGEPLRERIERARLQHLRAKRMDEIERNPDLAVLSEIDRYLATATPIADNDGQPTQWYLVEAILASLKSSRLVKVGTMTALTQSLLRLGVISRETSNQTYLELDDDGGQRQTGGRQRRVYRLDRGDVRGRLDRSLEGLTEEVQVEHVVVK